MTVEEREVARLGDRVVTTTSHRLHTYGGVFERGPGLYGTVTIEDFPADTGAVYVEFVSGNGTPWSMPLKADEYRVVKRAESVGLEARA